MFQVVLVGTIGTLKRSCLECRATSLMSPKQRAVGLECTSITCTTLCSRVTKVLVLAGTIEVFAQGQFLELNGDAEFPS